MELFDRERHVNCFNYEQKKELTIEYVEKKEGTYVKELPLHHEIFCLLDGSLRFSYGGYVDVLLPKGHMMLLPSNNNHIAVVEKKVSAIVFRLHKKIDFCDHQSFESLYEERKHVKVKNEAKLLKANSRLSDFLYLLKDTFQDGLRCGYYHELKQKELFHLLNVYYPQEELVEFFLPMLSNDIIFSKLVYENLYKGLNISELASAMNYSLSGFKKRFKRVFGVSAQQWVNQERARKIYHEINCSRKTFTELAFEYEFSSPSHFNDFCKKNFGKTPGNIRKEKKEW